MKTSHDKRGIKWFFRGGGQKPKNHHGAVIHASYWSRFLPNKFKISLNALYFDRINRKLRRRRRRSQRRRSKLTGIFNHWIPTKQGVLHGCRQKPTGRLRQNDWTICQLQAEHHRSRQAFQSHRGMVHRCCWTARESGHDAWKRRLQFDYKWSQ